MRYTLYNKSDMEAHVNQLPKPGIPDISGLIYGICTCTARRVPAYPGPGTYNSPTVWSAVTSTGRSGIAYPYRRSSSDLNPDQRVVTIATTSTGHEEAVTNGNSYRVARMFSHSLEGKIRYSQTSLGFTNYTCVRAWFSDPRGLSRYFHCPARSILNRLLELSKIIRNIELSVVGHIYLHTS